MQGAREGCAKLVYGAGRSLPAVVDDCYAFEDFGELSDDLGALGAAAEQEPSALSALSCP